MQSKFCQNQIRNVAPVLFVSLVSVVVLSSGCATTINESAATTLADNVSAETTTVTIDEQASTEALLDQMLTAINVLSDAMQKSDRKTANKKIDEIVLLSNAVRPTILTLSDQLAADFDRVVALAKSSVERNRPADADKALRFLPLIIDSLDNF